MKKIIIVSAVKNECDIIESFCRYNLSFCDALLIYENHKSSDNTREIIKNLIDEGLPIFFEAEKKDIYYEKAKGLLAEAAVKKHGADIVLQLDADEFLCHTDGINPRDALENLKEDVEYQMRWRTYVYMHEPKMSGGFLPSAFTHYRSPALEQAQGHAGKTIASRYLLKTKRAKFVHGGHWLEYPEKYKTKAKIEISGELVCAHYPIRSKRQIISKAIPNYINKWIQPEQERPPKDLLNSFQLGLLFNDVQENGEITENTMKEVSIRYSLSSGLADKEKIEEILNSPAGKHLKKGAIETSFCDNLLTMRYSKISDDNKQFLQATLSVLDDALQSLDAESRGKNQKVDELLWKAGDLERQLNDITATYKELVEHHKEWSAHHDELSAQHTELIKSFNDALSLKDAAERNCRELTEQLSEFERQAEALIEKYG